MACSRRGKVRSWRRRVDTDSLAESLRGAGVPYRLEPFEATSHMEVADRLSVREMFLWLDGLDGMACP